MWLAWGAGLIDSCEARRRTSSRAAFSADGLCAGRRKTGPRLGDLASSPGAVDLPGSPDDPHPPPGGFLRAAPGSRQDLGRTNGSARGGGQNSGPGWREESAGAAPHQTPRLSLRLRYRHTVKPRTRRPRGRRIFHRMWPRDPLHRVRFDTSRPAEIPQGFYMSDSSS